MDSAPKSVDFYFKLATLWIKKKKTERAIAMYQEALKVQPDHLPTYLELGQQLTQINKTEEAIAIYRQAIKLHPNVACLPQYLQQLTNRNAPVSFQTKNKLEIGDQNEVKQVNILLYTDCSGTYGAEHFAHSLMKKLIEHNYGISCAQGYAQHKLIEEREQLGINHLWLEADNIYGEIYNQQESPKAFANFAEAEKVILAVQPSLIIFNDGCPVSNLAAKEVACKFKIPFLAIVHCVSEDWTSQFSPYLERLALVYQSARQVIAVSQANLNLLSQKFGLPSDKGKVIYNGRPKKYFTPTNTLVRDRLRQELNIPPDGILIFTSGRLDLVKGYHHQLNAIAQLQTTDLSSQLYFAWAGIGSLEGQLRFSASYLADPQKLIFLGERNDIPDLLDAADIFVLTSEFEGMPLSIMEAMAKGLPVIATAVSGIPEELADTGKLLGDPNLDFKTTIQELVDTVKVWSADREIRQKIGDRCQKRASKMFTESRMLAEYLSIIKSLKLL